MYLSTEDNVRKLATKIGEIIEMEDVAMAREFLRVKATVNAKNSLVTGYQGRTIKIYG